MLLIQQMKVQTMIDLKSNVTIVHSYTFYGYLSQPVTWQFVSLPLRGLKDPLLFSLLGCRMYRSTLLVHGRARLRLLGTVRMKGVGMARGGGGKGGLGSPSVGNNFIVSPPTLPLLPLAPPPPYSKFVS